ncbi:hypothetical protein, partial [Desulfobulbus sp.]|uniref:hypothetical protein n=1 Tax=Desulfobulbus sp. TaxID=895 RepID=UPI0027B91A27
MKTKPFSLFLLLASVLLSSALLLSCTKEKKEKPAAPQPAKVEAVKPPSLPTGSAPVVKKDGPVSLDFDNSPLSEVALFVTSQTGKGFILNGVETKLISWIEYNIPREKLLDAFANTLAAFDLILKPTNDARTVFTIDKIEELKVPYKLDFATSKRGTFFLFGSTVYSKEKFPYPVKHDSGHWFA